jgi:TetR/AcrR family transcriptional regulator, transcriptional repressor for nem operon
MAVMSAAKTRPKPPAARRSTPPGAGARTDARTRLLDAAMQVIRQQGYSATSVDDICRSARLTKGAFFHHFKSKEDLAVAAAAHFSAMAERLFAAAPYREPADPLDRLLGYIDFRSAIIAGPIADFTCLLGTMVQEAYDTHPAIRRACETYIGVHAAGLAKDIEAAKALYAPEAAWSALSLALHTQAVLQGAFILAKAKGGPAIARDSLAHLKRYIEQLFHRPISKEEA